MGVKTLLKMFKKKNKRSILEELMDESYAGNIAWHSVNFSKWTCKYKNLNVTVEELIDGNYKLTYYQNNLEDRTDIYINSTYFLKVCQAPTQTL